MKELMTIVMAAVLCFATSIALAAAKNKYAVAVIVGNKNYSHKRVPQVAYAHRDAEAIKRYVTDILGYDPENVFDLRDASQAKLISYFGRQGNHEGLLWRNIDQRGRSDVLVYYSGHGVPGQKDKRGYLLPVDADPNTAELNGFPVDILYENLAKLKTKSMTVLLDACFSGDSHSGMLIRSASPVYIKTKTKAPKNMTVLTAASGEQLASWDEKRKHGLFTDRFLDGVYGAADANGNGQVTLSEMEEHLFDTMTRSARRIYGRKQNATIAGKADHVLAALPGKQAIARPKLGTGAVQSTVTVATVVAVPAPRTSTDPSQIVLPSGLTLADWALLAEDRLAAKDYTKLMIEAASHRRKYGDLSAILGVLDRAVAGKVGDIAVGTSTQASAALPQLNSLAESAGPLPAILALQAKAHHVLQDYVKAGEAYSQWLRTAPADHPDRKKTLKRLAKAQAGKPAIQAVGTAFRDCAACPDMVVVPAGSFMMGSTGSTDSKPVRRVTFAKPFAVGKFEVTQAEWRAVMGNNPSNFKGDSRPVEHVSWDDTQEFFKKLSARTGQTYRLLTEAEWEYVARAGSTTDYWWGDDIGSGKANCDGCGSRWDNTETAPVGSFAANRFGLHDVHGNVREWVEDCKGPYYGAPTDGTAVGNPHDSCRRMLRSGSWYHGPGWLDSTKRGSNTRDKRSEYVGFRVARTLDP